jgi:hypothetical protein
MLKILESYDEFTAQKTQLKNQKKVLKAQLINLKNKAYQLNLNMIKKKMSKNVAGPSNFN